MLLATGARNFATSELQKVLRDRQFFNILTWKCASRHSGVQFFDIWTSKSAPNPSVFYHFYLKMCFSLQRRAIFPHQNFKKWSEHAVFRTFWLANVLLATAACNFSTSQLQKVVRTWCVLYILTWKCASRHSGVQFLISPLTTWPRTRRFNEPTFRLTRHTNHWKNTAFRDFSNIWRGWIFFLLTFALLHLLSSDSTSSSDFLSCDFTSSICFSSAFQLSILSEVYYLNFLRQSDISLTISCDNEHFMTSLAQECTRARTHPSRISGNLPACCKCHTWLAVAQASETFPEDVLLTDFFVTRIFRSNKQGILASYLKGKLLTSTNPQPKLCPTRLSEPAGCEVLNASIKFADGHWCLLISNFWNDHATICNTIF